MIKNKIKIKKSVKVIGKSKIKKIILDKIQTMIMKVIKTEADKKYFHYEIGSGCYSAVKFFTENKIQLNKIYKAENIFKGVKLVQKGNVPFVRRVVRKLLSRVFNYKVSIIKSLPDDKQYATEIKFVK